MLVPSNTLEKLGTQQPLQISINSLDSMYLLSQVKYCWIALKIANLLAMTCNISLDVAALRI